MKGDSANRFYDKNSLFASFLNDFLITTETY